MTVTVSVYQKDGLCRGHPIGNATFRASSGIVTQPLSATQGTPLSSTEHVYIVATAPWNPYELCVDSPSHQPWTFSVRDGERHDIWLSPG